MIRILFLCMGNICRSPAAHCVFQEMVNQANLADHFFIDSAGTIGFHQGNEPDGRMQDAMRKRKVPIIGRSRQINKSDLEDFDLILAMDNSNLMDAQSLDTKRQWHDKIKCFAEYCADPTIMEIPDPYYGYDDGFEIVLDLIEEGCQQLLLDCQKQLNR
jgi:protein-tyrosine phosphatase